MVAGRQKRDDKHVPAATLSGGKLSAFVRKGAQVVEWRVWVHPGQGDDFYFRFEREDFDEAVALRAEKAENSQYALVEPVIAVVWDEEQQAYREVVIDLGMSPAGG